MANLFLKDTAFFSVKSPDLTASDSVTKLASEDVIQITITEELGKVIRGNILFRDPDHFWSRSLRHGQNLEISYGYKRFNNQIAGAGLSSGRDQNEIQQLGAREGIKCIVEAPGGGGDERGNSTYEMSFYGSQILGGKAREVFDEGTREDVITTLMGDIGVTDPIIDFDTSDNELSKANSIRQWGTSYNELLRLAFEWRAVFHVNFSSEGNPTAIFVDATKLKDRKTVGIFKDVYGKAGSVRTFFYNDGDRSNVKSYRWKHNVGESGQGDGVRITLVNGMPTIQRFNAETQKVTTYKINTRKIKERYKNKSLTESTALLSESLKTSDFEQIKWAFDAVEESTAPQGMGIEVDLNLNGDPLLTPPLEAKFEGNWPGILQQSKSQLGALTRFYLRKAVHTFTKSGGYQMSASVADSYTINGSAIAPDSGIG